MKHKINFANVLVLPLLLLLSCQQATDNHQKILLADGWNVQSSAKAGTSGLELSDVGYDASAWYKASVPSTVMGTLIKNGLYPDIFMGTNFKNVDKTQFDSSWWYHREFELPSLHKNQFVQLTFEGISYYANIWLNGKQIASKDTVLNSFRIFSFDITKQVLQGKNALAVEIFRQRPGDFGIGYADWNPRPQDENMGLWRDVYLKITGGVEVEHTAVESKLNLETLKEASLVIRTDLTNHADHEVKGILKGEIDSVQFTYEVSLNAGETKDIKLTEKEIPSLHFINPKLWWCNGLGEPNLYKLKLSFSESDNVSDEEMINFGIREIRDYYTDKNFHGFILNGKKVMIRGAGWTDDIFLRDNKTSNETQVQYVKDMNLNTIRFESFWGSGQNIYDLCDKYGLMVMVGWSCQWEWDNYLGKPCDDFGGIQTEKEMDLVVDALNDQVRWLRSHPSIISWFVGSDKLPKPVLEERYKNLFSKIDDRSYLAAAASHNSTVSGPTGVKMNGPYEYEGPVYWYADTLHGGAFGFNTETGPGPQVPVKETILRMIPQDKLWPINDTWNYHCTKATEAFNKLDGFNESVESRFGKARDLDDYILKAELTQYEAIRPMYEAFRANEPNTTGIVQWMLNSAWPSFYWQLYDYYLIPTSAYYGAKKANEPLQLIYNYKSHSVYAVNATGETVKNLKAKFQLFNTESKVLSENTVNIDLTVNPSQVFKLEPVKGVVFLSLQLMNDHDQIISSNFYWLSEKPDIFAWDKTTWAYTPMKSYADFKILNSLPMHDIEMKYTNSVDGDDVHVNVTLTNNNTIAFFSKLVLTDKDNKIIRPVFWSDNYFSLLPGETKKIECGLSKDLFIEGSSLSLSGWNVKPQLVKLK